MNKILFKIFLLIFVFNLIFAQSARETRGIWVSTNYRLDWPPKTYSGEEQKSALKKIFRDIRSRNFNTVYLQVRSSGTVIYPSDIEPFSPYFTGKIDSVGSYDPLQYAVKLAHSFGLELHVWVNVFNIYSGNDISTPSSQRSVNHLHPNWVIPDNSSGTKNLWLDPGLPEVRAYLVKLISELADKYNIDGITLDYMRYPSPKFKDDFSYLLYGNGADRNNWRRGNINAFLDSLYHKVKIIKPLIKIGCTPLGVYKNKKYGRFLTARDDVFQDVLYYLKSGIIDYAVPQIYWRVNFNPSFRELAKFWTANSFGRNVVLNIGAYKPEVKKEIFAQINIARKNKSAGVAIYRYTNIKFDKNIKFKDFVFPSEMPWVDNSVPETPHLFSANVTGVDPLSIVFSWSAKSDKLRNFALYKITDKKPKLFALLPPGKNSIRIEIKNPESDKYVFALKGVSKLWNESNEFSRSITLFNDSLQVMFKSHGTSAPVLLNSNAGKFIKYYSESRSVLSVFAADKTNEALLLKIPLTPGINVIVLPEVSALYSKIKLKDGAKLFNLELKK